jgi:hypothetical protein
MTTACSNLHFGHGSVPSVVGCLSCLRARGLLAKGRSYDGLVEVPLLWVGIAFP